jgi:hypothetical protein
LSEGEEEPVDEACESCSENDPVRSLPKLLRGGEGSKDEREDQWDERYRQFQVELG